LSESNLTTSDRFEVLQACVNGLGAAIGRIERELSTIGYRMDEDRATLYSIGRKLDALQAHRLLKDFKRNRKKKRR